VSQGSLPSVSVMFAAMDDRFLVLADYMTVFVVSLRDFSVLYSTATTQMSNRRVRTDCGDARK